MTSQSAVGNAHATSSKEARLNMTVLAIWTTLAGVSDSNNARSIWNFYDANNRVFVTDDSLATTSGGAGVYSHSYARPAGLSLS